MGDRAPRRRNAADRLRPLRRLARGIEVAQVRRFGRSGLSVVFGTPVLVLETTGRRSGRARRTVVAYHAAADGSLLVVAGAGGQARLPDWVVNLRGQPDAVVDRGRRQGRQAVRAIELTGPARAACWRDLRRIWPRIDAYERRAGRPVPVFRLVPTAAA